MNIDEFWTLVERVHATAPRDMKAKCQSLEQELRTLPMEELWSFMEHLVECFHRANKWDLWGVAYLIRRGCSDDKFMDFRYTLISLGRRAFESALADADSLAEFDIDPEWVCFEGYQYVPSKVYEDRFHGELPPSQADSKYPHHTTGEPFDEEEMTPRYPRLVAKYSYKDVEPGKLKELRRMRGEKQARTEDMNKRVRQSLLLGIIPSSGLVPPPRIAQQVMATGKSPAASGLRHEWEPFVMEEGSFWSVLRELGGALPDDLKERPDLHGKRITLDTQCSGIDDYDAWIHSLRERGLQ